MNEELRELFRKSELTQQQFAERIGVGKQRLKQIFKKDAYELKPSTFKKYLALIHKNQL